ncbi:MAG: hypothetical protein JJU00_00815 [Opitutales bacterium]|nr:hypothetical protein [Opitutales bacterium]
MPDDSLLAEALAACRPDGAVLVDEAFLDATPLITEGALRSASPFEVGVREAGRRLGAGRRIVFDLDDTLLNTDFTAKDGWFPDPLENAPGVDAWRYAAMRRDPWRTLRNGWRLPRRYSYSPRTYPFLGNPRVRAQWRPGVFAFLTGLREGGAELYLASATARARWRYLGTRFPLLNALFPDGHAACAEDLLAAALEAESAQADAATAGGFFYGKTPGLLRRAFGIEAFDTLVDDSAYVARAYAALGAENSVLHVPPGDPHGDAVARIAAELARRFASKDAAAAASSALTGGEVKPLAVHRFEDPFYYPTLHIPERHDRVAEVLRRTIRNG